MVKINPSNSSQKILQLALCGSLAACGAKFGTGAKADPQPKRTETDPYLALEDVESATSLAWRDARNAKSVPNFENDTRYQTTYDKILEIVAAEDRVPEVELHGDNVYNFWEDQANPRGIWRRATLASYKTATPQWETLIDIGKLNQDEGKSWVLKSIYCLEPSKERCFINLSDGGEDAVAAREWDMATKTFIADGFISPKAKQIIAWEDKDTLLISTDFGVGSLTSSGYPRIVKQWKRGTPLSDAKTILEIPADEMRTYAWRTGEVSLVVRQRTFWTATYSVLKDGALTELALPQDVEVQGVFKGHVIFSNRSDLTEAGTTYPAGSILAYKIDDKTLQSIYAPAVDEAFAMVGLTSDSIIINSMKNVLSRLTSYSLTNNKFEAKQLNLPSDGTMSIVSLDDTRDQFIASYESFLIPRKYYLSSAGALDVIKEAPARFDATPYTFSQKWATSTDGTKIPYFIVHKTGLDLNSSNPTLLYAYGGFEVPSQPSYLSFYGPTWLEKGGVYVVANIRGGGEFGPKWHQAALKENRQKAFDDFFAVAQDLIDTKVTSAAKLGIRGGSNGGLLMGAAFTQKPELFKAVLCLVPLLDMIRYHKLLAGASWMGEYGNPDIAAEEAYIRKYSPYQNVDKNKKYPEIYFSTSTKDDRVHPGHARKMVARLEEYGNDVWYYENPEGGHAAAADPKQKAKSRAYEQVYLYQQLLD